MSVAPKPERNADTLRCEGATLDAKGRTSNIGKDGPDVLMARLELYPNA